MIEGRIIISSIEEAKKKVEELGGVFKGEYIFKDIIFIPKREDFNLSDDVLRIRVYLKTNWPTKNVVLIRKQSEFKTTGKIDRIILKEEFDIEKEALEYVENYLSSEFKMGFEISRTGWQYQLENQRIFIEDIEDFKPSIEIESETEEELKLIFDKFDVIEKINESMPEIMRRIKLVKPVDMIIERGGLEDLEQIVDFNYKIFDGMYENEPYSLEQYKDKLKDKDPVIFISKNNDEITGDSISFKRDNSFYIWILGVSEKYRGQGTGSSLLYKNEKFAQANGFESVSTKVYNVSVAMQNILKKRGYKITKVEDSNTDPKYTAIRFELKLKTK